MGRDAQRFGGGVLKRKPQLKYFISFFYSIKAPVSVVMGIYVTRTPPQTDF